MGLLRPLVVKMEKLHPLQQKTWTNRRFIFFYFFFLKKRQQKVLLLTTKHQSHQGNLHYSLTLQSSRDERKRLKELHSKPKSCISQTSHLIPVLLVNVRLTSYRWSFILVCIHVAWLLCVPASCLWNMIRGAGQREGVPDRCSMKATPRRIKKVMNKWWSLPPPAQNKTKQNKTKQHSWSWRESEYRCADNVPERINNDVAGTGWNRWSKK